MVAGQHVSFQAVLVDWQSMIAKIIWSHSLDANCFDKIMNGRCHFF